MTVRWVDTNKGSEEVPEVRSRLVARDFKGKKGERDDELYAATPPVEAMRMMCSKMVAPRKSRKRRKMLLMDVRKAHLNPKCEEDVYIELPAECGAPPGTCGKLNIWL